MTTDSAPVSVVHRVSVTKGTIGCSRRSVTSRTSPRTRRTASACGPPLARVVLESSTYQSKTSSQAKWYSASESLENW